MSDLVEEAPLEHLEALDAYGDVPLGVECAWPTAEHALLPQTEQGS